LRATISSSTATIVFLGLLCLLATTGEVIAAPPGLEQPATPVTDGSIAVQIVPLVLGVLAAGLILWRRWHGLDAAPPRPLVFSPPWALGLVLGMFVLGQLGAMAAAAVTGLDLVDAAGAGEPLTLAEQTKLLLGVYAAEAIVLVAYLSRCRPTGVPKAEDPRPGPARTILIAIAAIVLVWPIATAVGWLAGIIHSRITGEAPDPIAHSTLQMIVDSDRGVWLAILLSLVILSVPVLEELLYRGLLQDALVRIGLNRWMGIGLASLVFALMHYTAAAPHAVPVLFVLGVGFGWAYERTGRLLAPIVMHALFNLGNVLLAMAMA
jgi:membrane protease YdiL (CAAX protease family)